MELQQYPLTADPSLMVFEFTSKGPNGNIQKMIKYDQMEARGVYHMGFGDKDEFSNSIDYYKVDNNGDTEMILATVAASLYRFFHKYHGVWVYAKGSTPARTRLYRMGISKFMERIEADFEVYGLQENGWVIFEKNSPYEAFMVKQK
jgi:hypothetical protein